MATMEQVERLREKTNVSYEEARAALEACNDDLLDAIIYLEKQGKVAGATGYYSTQKEDSGGASREIPPEEPPASAGFSDLLRRFGAFCVKLLGKGNRNTFEIYRHAERRTFMPVTVLVLLLVFAFWITIPLLIVGLFFGFRYRFSGPDLGKSAVNDPIDSAADAAEELKNSMKYNR
jgi:hypothetical protein